MWNMPKGGFEELYKKIPAKPPFEDAWRLTDGNPGISNYTGSIGTWIKPSRQS
jgi:hypothetical protein